MSIEGVRAATTRHDPASDDGDSRVAVLMPTYGQAEFIGRAIESVFAQTVADWELVIVDDASPDETRAVVAAYLNDQRVRYHRLERNVGLGATLNVALDLCSTPVVAYLPSDDVYHRDHLATLLTALRAEPGTILAFAGVRHHYNRFADGQIDGEPLQLVQVMHRRTGDRWLERSRLVTDDLERMYWGVLRERGAFVGTGRVTCEWVDHPRQRHKILREPLGGINRYRDAYAVQDPIRMKTSVGNLIDEGRQYRAYRERPDTPPAPDALKILLVGELAYNPDRVLALEERGHRLFGLWMPEPQSLNTVGPLPFGHVVDLPRQGWRAAVRDLRPDVIYALLNWQAVPFCCAVLRDNPGVPFVWHFKEGPFICLEKGSWRELVDLTVRADGRIFSSSEQRDWMATVCPAAFDGPTLVLDGDLPKADWFIGKPVRRLSAVDGEIHTVVPGRPIGLHPPTVAALAAEGIHLHFYGDFTQGLWREWIAKVERLAPRHFHLHPQVDQDAWLSEFSRYDAGWLHCFESANGGDVRRANWDDLNYPARIATLAIGGLPMIQRDNAGSTVATQALAKEREIGVFFREIPELAATLRDEASMHRLRANVWRQRQEFAFDTHADRLLGFFREVIAARG